jgi:nicotinamide-nucleotide amidase
MTSLFPSNISQLAEKVLSAARAKKLKIVTAESCTGGLISGCLTDIAGSSDVVERGFVTYSNEAKEDMIGVDIDILKEFGAVSAETAAEMADGALDASPADISVAVTGIAGPGGATPQKPVGLVYIGIANRDGAVRTVKCNFSGDRATVRLATVQKALEEVLAEVADIQP